MIGYDRMKKKEVSGMTRVRMDDPLSKQKHMEEDRVLKGWDHELGFDWILVPGSAFSLLHYVVLIEIYGKSHPP